ARAENVPRGAALRAGEPRREADEVGDQRRGVRRAAAARGRRKEDVPLAVDERRAGLAARFVLELAEDRPPGDERLDDADARALLVDDGLREHGDRAEADDREGASLVAHAGARRFEALAELEIDVRRPDVRADEAAAAVQIDAAQRGELGLAREGGAEDLRPPARAERILAGELNGEPDRVGGLRQLLRCAGVV